VSTHAETIEFKILGSLETRKRGEVLDLGGPKQRTLLALLLLNANRVTPVAQLIDDLWGEAPPETAANTLQVYVSQLRKILEPGVRGKKRVLQTISAGYTAVVEDAQLDLHRFESLMVEGREAILADELELARRQLREALALWRGPCLAELPLHLSGQWAVARLNELRLAVQEDLIVVELALGNHGKLVPELETLVLEHRYRETLRGHLMLALYRSGRQADALEVFRQERHALVEELGIEPTRELQRLEQAILRQDPALDLEPRAPRGAPEAAQRRESATAAPELSERRATVAVAVIDVLIDARAGVELDPEVVSGVAARAFELVARCIERHHGLVYRVIGTRVVVMFGAAAVHEDDALRAARALVEAVAALPALGAVPECGPGFRVGSRAGIEAGVALVARDSDGRLTVTSPVIASAERASAAGEPGEIIVGGTAYALLADSVQVEPAGTSSADFPLWRLLEVAPGAASGRRRHDAPFVGRAEELAELRHALDRAVRARRALLVNVVGEAGIGKSRIVLELRGQADPAPRILWGACPPYGEGVTFTPLAEIVAELVGGASVRSGIEALLGGDDEAEAIAAAVAGAIGAGEPAGAAEEVFRAVRHLLEVAAREQPLVLVFDDLHWAEPTFLDLIEHVAEWSRDAPIVLLCLARPELLDQRPAWGSGSLNATTLVLEPLSETESMMLIDELAAGRELAPKARARLASLAGGNPFFVEQLLAMAAQEPRFAAEPPSPPTVQALLTARLDRLHPDERTVLEHASVLGAEFTCSGVARLLPEPLRDMARGALDRLAQRKLVRALEDGTRGSERFTFTHVLVRAAAYDSLPKRRRAALHAELADWLEADDEHRPDLDEIVGYHLEEAYRYRLELGTVGEAEAVLAERGTARLAAAARRADALGDMPAAVSLLTRAAALVPSDHPARPEILAELGEALRDAGQLDRAETTLDEAITAATRTGDAAAEARALAVRWQVRLQTDPGVSFEEAANAIGTTIDRLLELGNERGLAKAWVSLAEVPWLRGQAAASEQALERGLTYARKADDGRTEALALNALVGVVFSGPMPVKPAIARCEEVLAQTRGDGRVAASAFRALAGLHAMEGRFEEAWELANRDRAIILDLGLKVVVSSSASVAGLVGLLADDPARAETALRWGYEILDEMGDRNGLATVAGWLAEAVLVQGRDEEALVLTALCAEAGAAEDLTVQVQWRGPRAKALLLRGDVDAAVELAREAAALAKGTDFLDLHATALLDLCEVLAGAGRVADGSVAAQGALALYRRKGNRVGAARARGAIRRASLARM
jgi:DNA-binding SARP family transcriptional activator/tetratricopeptide (TPR) repeat protein